MGLMEVRGETYLRFFIITLANSVLPFNTGLPKMNEFGLTFGLKPSFFSVSV